MNNAFPSIMQGVLDNWHQPTITSLDLKNYLIQNHPEYFWKQSVVSQFLSETDLMSDDNGTYKVYHLNRSGLRYSQSKRQWVDITSMATPHLVNAIRKDYSDATIEDILSQPTSECFLMLQEYMNRI